tara:strand:+ start:234 stop:656 length:423 start_codon:yes stop_codon:yes gene_type:complete
MFAVVKTNGKQYRVMKDDILIVDKIDTELGNFDLDQVLMIGDGSDLSTGKPFIEGALVKTEIIEHKKSKSITVFKKNRRHNYRRTKGHRQDQTVLKVIDIITKNTKKVSTKPSSGKQTEKKAKKNLNTNNSKKTETKEKT